MTEHTFVRQWKVNIIESERGWGRDTLETKYFNSHKKAVSFLEKYNASLPDGPAPDYYIQAEGPYEVK